MLKQFLIDSVVSNQMVDGGHKLRKYQKTGRLWKGTILNHVVLNLEARCKFDYHIDLS